jgi:hypothetical protein
MTEIENLCIFKTHAEVPRSYKKYVALITDNQEVIYHPEMSIKLTTEAGCKLYVKEICDEEVLTGEGFVFKKGISTKEGQKMFYLHLVRDGIEYIEKYYIPNDTPYGILHDTPIAIELFTDGSLLASQTINSDETSAVITLCKPGTSIIEVPKIIEGGKSVKFVLPDSYFRFDSNTSTDSYSSITNVELSRTIDKIADRAFNNCKILKEVKLPSNLKEIGEFAFMSCVALTNITIPEGISVLQEGTFYGCYKMSGVTLPSTLTYIGESCFSYCNDLTYVDLPQGLLEIDSNAFAYCDNLTSLTIPDSVIHIGYNAFHDCPNIKSITISSGTSLDSSVFSNVNINYDDIHWEGHDGLELRSYGVTIADIVRNPEGYEIFQNRVIGCWDSSYNITQVNLPNTVTAIDDDAFKDCNRMQSLNMPEGLESIGVEAFSNCTSLSSITIPSTVTYIGTNAFEGCRIRGLENVSWIGHSDFNISDYGGIAYDVKVIDGMVIEGDTLTGCVGSLTEAVIPNQVKIIGDNAFASQPGLTSVTLPSGLTYIGNSAFYGTNITEITIPSGVTTIRNAAFMMCQNLKTVSILSPNVDLAENAFGNCYLDRDNISWVDHEIPTDFGGAYMVTEQNDGLLIRENAAFKCRAFATDVTIPNTVTSINQYAFYCIQSLSSVTIPSSIANIGQRAFESCTNLTSIRIPNSEATIAQDAFGHCDNLDTIYFDGSVTYPNDDDDYGPFSANNAIVLPTNNVDGLQIENGIIKGCARYVSNLVIPNTVTAIGFKAFSEKRTWQSLYNTFSAVTIPDSVISISGSAFEGVSTLQTANIPSSVTYFGSSIFASTGLKDITISEGVTCIPSGMFNICKKLTSVTLPSTINQINSLAFSSCGSLSGINIPTSVTVIQESAFGSCNSLTTITIPNGVLSIPNDCFFQCRSLSEITIPETVQSIGSWAFSECSGLTEVSIPQTVTLISQRAFAKCSGLTRVTMYDNLT